jgi:hypothetical protein
LSELGDQLLEVREYVRNSPPRGQYWNDPTLEYEERRNRARPVEAIDKIVARSANTIALEDLRTLSKLEDLHYGFSISYDTPGYGDGRDEFDIDIDVSAIRQRAAAELARRGARRANTSR